MADPDGTVRRKSSTGDSDEPNLTVFITDLWGEVVFALRTGRGDPTLTETAVPQYSWSGETGRIMAGMLSRLWKGPVSPVYDIAGPPAMVSGLRAVLNSSAGGDDDIRVKEFTGY